MSERYDVLAVGNAIVDIVRRCDENFLQSLATPKGQMTLVQTSASITAIAKALPRGTELAGGSTANTAVGIASLGGRAALLGMVADDDLGRLYQHDVRSIGVEFPLKATAVAGKETGRSLILVTPDGRRTMHTYLGCSADLNDNCIDSSAIVACKFLLLEGYLFDLPKPKATFSRALAAANASRKRVALSLPDTLCIARHRSEFLHTLRSGIYLVIANERELMALYGLNTLEAALRLAAMDVPLAAVTCSERGSILINRGTQLFIPPEPVSKLVDATGAGDMYAAGLLYGLSKELDPVSAGRLGSFAASEIISCVGARPEVPLGKLARLRGLL